MSMQTLNKQQQKKTTMTVLLSWLIKKINRNERGKTVMFTNGKFIRCCVFVI